MKGPNPPAEPRGAPLSWVRCRRGPARRLSERRPDVAGLGSYVRYWGGPSGKLVDQIKEGPCTFELHMVC